jgi:4-amino-4-deoxy-L-arabinose transferase-like glycosyltransferase
VSPGPEGEGRFAGLLAWSAALVIALALLAATGYQARDPDSRLYAEIAERMSAQPLSRWIAPDWPPGWYRQGLFREHPVGIHVLPALLARLGYPAGQAAYALNTVYQVLTIVLIARLAATLADGTEARALAWLIQLLPVAFTYRVRANHEQAVVLCLLVALVGAERARSRPRWALLTVAGLVGLVLVKGVVAVLGPAVCALWLLLRRRAAATPAPPDRAAWVGLAVATAAMFLTGVLYEQAYRQATGESFWSPYLGQQLGIAAAPVTSAFLANKAYNLVWYAGRVLWFPFPWSLALLAAAWHGRAELTRWLHPTPSPAPNSRDAVAGVLFALGITALYLGLFSLSDRRADRYIFPVYYAVGAAGAIAGLPAWPGGLRLAARFDRRRWWPAALFVFLFALHLLGGRLGLPHVKVWGPET